MRFHTAAILSVALIGGMFAAPAAIWAAFLPALKQGLPDPIPGCERILLDIAVFCDVWRFVLAIPIAAVLFTVPGFTNATRGRK